MVQKFKDLYSAEVIPYLKETFDYKNLHQIPKIEKIQINRGLGVAAQNKKVLDKSVASVLLLRALTRSPMLPPEALILANSSRGIFPSVAANQIR